MVILFIFIASTHFRGDARATILIIIPRSIRGVWRGYYSRGALIFTLK
jgi:hypothetical protein